MSKPFWVSSQELLFRIECDVGGQCPCLGLGWCPLLPSQARPPARRQLLQPLSTLPTQTKHTTAAKAIRPGKHAKHAQCTAVTTVCAEWCKASTVCCCCRYQCASCLFSPSSVQGLTSPKHAMMPPHCPAALVHCATHVTSRHHVSSCNPLCHLGLQLSMVQALTELCMHLTSHAMQCSKVSSVSSDPTRDA